jgi:alpha-tubulin suppressor-like RCC1 family protein
MTCGRGHVLLTTKDNEIFVWGDNSSFEIGLDSDRYNTPTLLPKTKLNNEHVKKICAGVKFTIFFTNSGLWGSGKKQVLLLMY